LKARLAASHSKRLAHAHIERLSSAGALDVMPLVRGFGEEIRFPVEMRRVDIHNVQGDRAVPVGFVEVNAIAAMLAHLFKPQLLKAVDALIDQNTDHDAAMTPEKRAAATAETAAEVLLAARHLAELTWRAIDQGLPAAHAADADPIAVLGIEASPAPSRPPVEPGWPMVIERVGV
jgi:hypothetical protein